MSAETIVYSNYGKCCRIHNGTAEVLVTLDFGPRVIKYSFTDGDNMFAELDVNESTETEFGVWRPRGGHRLWHAPETKPRSYSPDDSPMESVEASDLAVTVTQAVEPGTGIRKRMKLEMAAEGSCVRVTHTLTNANLWAVEFAPWALTIVRGGGVTIVPQAPFAPHSESLQPARPLAVWSYTDLSDSRWTLGARYLLLRTDTAADTPQKIGAGVNQGWAAYHSADELFVKRFPYFAGANYPDFGCNFETYTKGDFMEVETLGPLSVVEPGQSVEHVEVWSLFSGVSIGDTEDSIDEALTPLISQTDSL